MEAAMAVMDPNEFVVDWDDLADARLTWSPDRMHHPTPVVPLAQAVFKAADRIFGSRSIYANGFRYSSFGAPPMPPPEVLQRGMAIWEEDYVPRLRAYCEGILTRDWDALSAAELAAEIESLPALAAEHFALTMVVVLPFQGPTMQLVATSESVLGPDGPRLVGILLQGHDNTSSSGGAGLYELALCARQSPELSQLVRAGNLHAIAGAPGGAEFLARLHAYLHEYGWRLESWSALEIPTWAENPSLALELIARYLDGNSLSPVDAAARALEERRQARAEIEARLDPGQRECFLAMVDAAQHHVGLSESRAHWQLAVYGVLRKPILALGRKLVYAGVIAAPDDVLFLYLDEALAAARQPAGSMAATVAARRADFDRWRALTPPPFLGTPPADDPGPAAMFARHFFGTGVAPSTDDRLVNGIGASRGVATGRARVIHSLAESDRLEPGDILVCISTASPWTPLFSVAAGIVTDTGGVLSHSAICAREYAIPAVVGTQFGTARIHDGATITVDGERGTVRIL
jgi:pyruvate,water dikinase